MLQYKDKAEEYMRWILGNGIISVHKDCWLSHKINGSSNLQVKDLFYANGLPNIELIRDECGDETVREIIDTNIHLQGGCDKLIWTLTPSGEFSFQPAWNMIRNKGSTCITGKHCWSHYMPKTISFFVWRLMKNAIPTDYALIKIGMPIISKCVCCYTGHSVEYSSHLLLYSDVAKGVWNFFYQLFVVQV